MTGKFCREVIIAWCLNNSADKISGPGTIVEKDESKFSKWKYNVDKLIECQRVFGGELPWKLFPLPSKDYIKAEPPSSAIVGRHITALVKRAFTTWLWTISSTAAIPLLRLKPTPSSVNGSKRMQKHYGRRKYRWLFGPCGVSEEHPRSKSKTASLLPCRC